MVGVAEEVAEDVGVGVVVAVASSKMVETNGEVRVVGVKVVELGEVATRELLPEVGVEHQVTTPTKLEELPTGAVELEDTVEAKEDTAKVDTEAVQCVRLVQEPAADTEQLLTAPVLEQEEWVEASKGATVEEVAATEVECKNQIKPSSSSLIYVRLGRQPQKYSTCNSSVWKKVFFMFLFLM